MNSQQQNDGILWRCEFCQDFSTSDGRDVKDHKAIAKAAEQDRIQETTCSECWNRIQVGDL